MNKEVCPTCGSDDKKVFKYRCLGGPPGNEHKYADPWHKVDSLPVEAERDWADIWAQDFHDTYERAAPKFGYETRPESAKPWSEVPEKNRKLMQAVVAEVLCRFLKSRE